MPSIAAKKEENNASAALIYMRNQVSPDYVMVTLYRRIKKKRRPGYEERHHLRELEARQLALEGGDCEAEAEIESSEEGDGRNSGDGCHGHRPILHTFYQLKVSRDQLSTTHVALFQA